MFSTIGYINDVKHAPNADYDFSLILDYNLRTAFDIVCLEDKEYFQDLKELFFPEISSDIINAYLDTPKSRDEERFNVPYEAIKKFNIHPMKKTSDILYDIITNGLRCKKDYIIQKKNNKRHFFLSAKGLRKYLFAVLDDETQKQLLILENMEYYYNRYLMQLNLICLEQFRNVPENVQEQVVRLIGGYHLKYNGFSVPRNTNELVDKCLINNRSLGLWMSWFIAMHMYIFFIQGKVVSLVNIKINKSWNGK